MSSNYYHQYTTSTGTPSLALSNSTCPECHWNLRPHGCMCKPDDILSEQDSQTTPQTSFPTSYPWANRFDDDKIDPSLENYTEKREHRVELDVPRQAPPLPQPVPPLGHPRQPLQGLDPAVAQMIAAIVNSHGSEANNAGSVTEMLSADNIHRVTDDAVEGVGTLFNAAANPHQGHPYRAAPSTTRNRQPLLPRTDGTANPPQTFNTNQCRPNSVAGTTTHTKARKRPAPNPARDAMRKMGRAIHAETDPELVCCDWDWVTVPDFRRHQRWHQKVPETSEWFCSEHMIGFHKKQDFDRHMQSHAGSLRNWYMCPRFGIDGCQTWFSHPQNMKRHLQGKPHNMTDDNLIGLEVHRAKTDENLRVQSIEKPTSA